MLSHRLPVYGLVGHYPTNYLIGRKPLLKWRPTNREPFLLPNMLKRSLRGIRPDFSKLSPSSGQVTYVLLSRPPLSNPTSRGRAFDLHALGAPPAFVLSQDQTLQNLRFPSTIQLLRCIHCGAPILVQRGTPVKAQNTIGDGLPSVL